MTENYNYNLSPAPPRGAPAPQRWGPALQRWRAAIRSARKRTVYILSSSTLWKPIKWLFKVSLVLKHLQHKDENNIYSCI